jgi:hypothetical protein
MVRQKARRTLQSGEPTFPALDAGSQVPLKKGGKAAGLGGCPDTFANQTNDNPRAVSSNPLSPFVKGELEAIPP